MLMGVICLALSWVLLAIPVEAVADIGANPLSHWLRPSGVVVHRRLDQRPPRASTAATGEAWSPPDNVQVNSDLSDVPQNETTISVDPLDSLHLVAGWNDWRLGTVSCGFGTSFDGGRTWSDGVLTGLPFGAQGDPSIDTDANGNVFLGCLSFNGAVVGRGSAIVVGVSRDAGRTFSEITEVVRGGASDLQDKPYLTVDNSGGAYDGSVYVAWTSLISTDDDPTTFEASDILWARSLDGGRTFSAPMIISDAGANGDGPVPAVGTNGEVYVAWALAGQLVIDRSLDGGNSFAPDVIVSDITFLPSPLGRGCAFRTNSFPGIAVDRSAGVNRGTVYLVWADYTSGDADVLLSASRDRGATWLPAVRVTDDPAGNGADQFMPWVSVDPNGRVHVMWYDRRGNPIGNGLPCLYNIYRSYSDDGGSTFAPNERVSSVTSNAAFDGFGGGFIGDYSGIAATESGPYPFWCDTRRGQSDVFVDVPPSPPTSTVTRTPTRTRTPSSTRTVTVTRRPSATPTPSNTRRPTFTPTHTWTSRPTRTLTPTPTVTRTRRPSATPTATFTRRPTRTPTHTWTPRSTGTPTATPTATNTRRASSTPTATVTRRPTLTPTSSATSRATRTPTPVRP